MLSRPSATGRRDRSRWAQVRPAACSQLAAGSGCSVQIRTARPHSAARPVGCCFVARRGGGAESGPARSPPLSSLCQQLWGTPAASVLLGQAYYFRSSHAMKILLVSERSERIIIHWRRLILTTSHPHPYHPPHPTSPLPHHFLLFLTVDCEGYGHSAQRKGNTYISSPPGCV